MDAFDCILDGLEQALGLERELGVRTVEIDRTLLRNGEAESFPLQDKAAIPARSGKDSASPLRSIASLSPVSLVFLHDRPLSPKGVEMVAKIIQALGLTAESAPVVVAPPVPKAKVVVVLGGLALKKYLPGMRGEPGQWLRTPKGTDVLVTYSPEYILRFASVTPAVLKIKQDMWRSLKAVKQRILLV